MFLTLFAWDDKILSTPKIKTFLAKSSPKLHGPAPSNAILLLRYLLLSYFVNAKLLSRFLRQQSKSWKMKHNFVSIIVSCYY